MKVYGNRKFILNNKMKFNAFKMDLFPANKLYTFFLKHFILSQTEIYAQNKLNNLVIEL